MNEAQVVQKKLSDFFARDEQRVLKIGLMGSHNTGKTTLGYTICSKLKTQHYAVIYVAEVARHIPAQLAVNEGTNFQAQYWILNEQINEEILARLRGARVIVTDRTVIDNYTYAYRAAQVGQISERDLKIMEAKCLHWASTYDFLFHVTIPRSKLEADGFRSTDRQFQIEIDTYLRRILTEWELTALELVGGNDQRVGIVLQALFKEELL